MSVNNKTKYKKVDKKKDEKNKVLIPSLVILFLMVLSIVGFSMQQGGGSEGSTSSEIPLQQFEQQGQVFWGAIKNNEQFIFLNIDTFEQEVELANLANQIKLRDNIGVYIDSNFSSDESLFLLDKVFRGLKIDKQNLFQEQCIEGVLYISNQDNLEGNCMKFIPEQGLEYNKTEVLVYHLIK